MKKKFLRRKENKLIATAAHNIKVHRMRLNLTQEQLEEKTGITVARCESGKYDMTLTTISILSKHLNIEPYELLK